MFLSDKIVAVMVTAIEMYFEAIMQVHVWRIPHFSVLILTKQQYFLSTEERKRSC